MVSYTVKTYAGVQGRRTRNGFVGTAHGCTIAVYTQYYLNAHGKPISVRNWQQRATYQPGCTWRVRTSNGVTLAYGYVQGDFSFGCGVHPCLVAAVSLAKRAAKLV